MSTLQQMAFKMYFLLTLSISLNASRLPGNIDVLECTKLPRLGHWTGHFGTHFSSDYKTMHLLFRSETVFKTLSKLSIHKEFLITCSMNISIDLTPLKTG